MRLFPLKPTHAPVKAYYAALAQFHLHGHKTEGNTRSAFADLAGRYTKYLVAIARPDSLHSDSGECLE